MSWSINKEGHPKGVAKALASHPMHGNEQGEAVKALLIDHLGKVKPHVNHVVIEGSGHSDSEGHGDFSLKVTHKHVEEAPAETETSSED